MAKSSKSGNKSGSPTKANASFSLKTPTALSPSRDNPSKYSPTEDAERNINTLDPEDGLLALFTNTVKDLYWAENHLVKSLPKMTTAAASAKLKTAITNHLEETKEHVKRLEQVFELLQKTPVAKKCDAMEGLTKEGEGVIEDTDTGTPARDLGIIMASQKVEHYEIAAYAGLILLAGKLGFNDIIDILQETLDEEIASDELLGNIADKNIQMPAGAKAKSN